MHDQPPTWDEPLAAEQLRYTIAHRAVPASSTLVAERLARGLPWSEADTQDLKQALWISSCRAVRAQLGLPEVPEHMVQSPTELSVRCVGVEGRPGALIALPTPRQPTHAFLALIVACTARDSGDASVTARTFTLEALAPESSPQSTSDSFDAQRFADLLARSRSDPRARLEAMRIADEVGRLHGTIDGQAVVCEWTTSGRHLNYGVVGPPVQEFFVAAAAAIMRGGRVTVGEFDSANNRINVRVPAAMPPRHAPTGESHSRP